MNKEEKMNNKMVAICLFTVFGASTIVFVAIVIGMIISKKQDNDSFTSSLALAIGSAIIFVISGFSAFPALLRMIRERRKNKKAKKNNINWKEKEE